MTENIVEFEAFRIRLLAKKSYYDRTDKRCNHYNFTLDDNGEIVRCDDCNVVLSAYWAAKTMTNSWAAALKKLEARESCLSADKSHILHLTAAKRVEKAWRSKGMVPACPHCDRGILPEDGLGSTNVNRAIELARRRHDPGSKPGRPIPEK